jgi:hypothetical protein
MGTVTPIRKYVSSFEWLFHSPRFDALERLPSTRTRSADGMAERYRGGMHNDCSTKRDYVSLVGVTRN